MADRPILFSSPMVLALLAGTKSQTRRVIHDAPAGSGWHMDRVGPTGWQWTADGGAPRMPYRPRYAAGDRLYVREAWHAARSLDGTPPRDIPRDADIEYAATARSYAEIGLKGKLRPGMFLPRWASRLTLTVTDVRVQRLQEISSDDARAEGVDPLAHVLKSYRSEYSGDGAMLRHEEVRTFVPAFQSLWDHLNAARGFGWSTNPWVVATSFTVALGNIDTLAEVA